VVTVLARKALDALMEFYDRGTGLWQPERPWWQSGNALQALLDYELRTGDKEYHWVLDHTVAIQRTAYMAGEFRADSTDDTAWWALALVRAFDVTGDERYLAIATTGAGFMGEYWDGVCGGGVWWDVERTYKNAISNELYVKLLASLHNRGVDGCLDRANEAWAWFAASGMVNERNLVNDGLAADCRNNGGDTWTYNQGVVLGALVELHRATGEPALLDTARTIADAATEHLSPNGILTEPAHDEANEDAPAFKGIFVRNLDELDRALPDRPYAGYLRRQARIAAASSWNERNQVGLRWSGPFDRADAARQTAALDLFTAVTHAGTPAGESAERNRPESGGRR
jgi:predicted alpha-1,6-mannanase (GH76 family)